MKNKKLLRLVLVSAAGIGTILYFGNIGKKKLDIKKTYSENDISELNDGTYDSKKVREVIGSKINSVEKHTLKKYEQYDDSIKSNIISLPDSYCSYDALKTILENQGYELIKKNNLKFSTQKLEIEDNSQIQSPVISLNNNSSIINGEEFPIGLLYKETSWWRY
jgi:glutaredoxin